MQHKQTPCWTAIIGASLLFYAACADQTTTGLDTSHSGTSHVSSENRSNDGSSDPVKIVSNAVDARLGLLMRNAR